MRRGTTPDITVTVNADLSDYDAVYLTLSSRSATVERTKDELAIVATDSGCTIKTALTQAETLLFRAGDTIRVQIRARKGDTAVATNIAAAEVTGLLKDGEI